MMHLVVDGLIFQKDPHGGIARLYRELLPRVCDLAPDLRVTLFIDGPLRAELPSHARILVRRAPALRRTLRVQGAWRRAIYPFRRLGSRAWSHARQLWLRGDQSAIWHSTYYTSPQGWRGPQVVTVHDMIHEQYPQFFSDPLDDVARLQKRQCVKQASAVICVSQATRSEMERFYDISKVLIRVVPNAYPADVFRVLPPGAEKGMDEPHSPYLLYVGSRVHYKNFNGLIQAYRNWEARDQVGLVVAGSAWTRAESRLLEEAGLSQGVRLLSDVADSALCRLYNDALAFVFPSLAEGFGIPLLEAMACGCPVVASRIPSTLEIAGQAPIYFEPDQPESLLAALEQARLAGRAGGRVEAGLERVKQFSWEQTARLTLEVYREVWSRAGKPSASA